MNACGCGKPALVGYLQWVNEEPIRYWWCLAHVPEFVVDEILAMHEADLESDHSQ